MKAKQEPFARFEETTLSDLRSSLPEYLAHMGVELKPSGSRLVGRCPMHEDSNPSFALLPGHEVCGCFPCDFVGDVFALAQRMGRASSFPDAVCHVAAVLGASIDQGSLTPSIDGVSRYPRPIRASKPETPPVAMKVCPKITYLPELTAEQAAEMRKARVAFSDAFDEGRLGEFADDLGVPLSTLRWCAKGHSGLGVVNGCLTYIYPAGLKVRLPAGSKPRFLWRFGKATTPWRADWIRPETLTVYLTEGESDCLALVAVGLEDDPATACVAIPGTSGFKPEWASLFRGKRVILCFDADNAGRAATATVAAMLKGHAAEILTWKGPANHG